ncbi:MAG: hypothetical protein QOD39_443, partial [Mycobacterium sp.]|nr:hypothetical protein [Mycobacterium sp.]
MGDKKSRGRHRAQPKKLSSDALADDQRFSSGRHRANPLVLSKPTSARSFGATIFAGGIALTIGTYTQALPTPVQLMYGEEDLAVGSWFDMGAQEVLFNAELPQALLGGVSTSLGGLTSTVGGLAGDGGGLGDTVGGLVDDTVGGLVDDTVGGLVDDT